MFIWILSWDHKVMMEIVEMLAKNSRWNGFLYLALSAVLRSFKAFIHLSTGKSCRNQAFNICYTFLFRISSSPGLWRGWMFGDKLRHMLMEQIFGCSKILLVAENGRLGMNILWGRLEYNGETIRKDGWRLRISRTRRGEEKLGKLGFIEQNQNIWKVVN